jgi:hypothetical protein
MVIDMSEQKLVTLAQLCQFLEGTAEVELRSCLPQTRHHPGGPACSGAGALRQRGRRAAEPSPPADCSFASNSDPAAPLETQRTTGLWICGQFACRRSGRLAVDNAARLPTALPSAHEPHRPPSNLRQNTQRQDPSLRLIPLGIDCGGVQAHIIHCLGNALYGFVPTD